LTKSEQASREYTLIARTPLEEVHETLKDQNGERRKEGSRREGGREGGRKGGRVREGCWRYWTLIDMRETCSAKSRACSKKNFRCSKSGRGLHRKWPERKWEKVGKRVRTMDQIWSITRMRKEEADEGKETIITCAVQHLLRRILCRKFQDQS
jgi:hypothetical protein